jgi:hypothetical protein
MVLNTCLGSQEDRRLNERSSPAVNNKKWENTITGINAYCVYRIELAKTETPNRSIGMCLIILKIVRDIAVNSEQNVESLQH